MTSSFWVLHFLKMFCLGTTTTPVVTTPTPTESTTTTTVSSSTASQSPTTEHSTPTTGSTTTAAGTTARVCPTTGLTNTFNCPTSEGNFAIPGQCSADYYTCIRCSPYVQVRQSRELFLKFNRIQKNWSQKVGN